jgi:hypothetical protein
MTRFGCAYWGRDAERADEHLGKLADEGFSWIVIPVSTERMRYDRDGVADIMAVAHDRGLEVRLAPWGVAGLFGGEGVAAAGDPLRLVEAWQIGAIGLNPDALYWDEPHGDLGIEGAWEGITEVSSSILHYLYLNVNKADWPPESMGRTLAGIGVDAYHDFPDALLWRDRAQKRYQIPVHVWVRNFRIPDHQTHWPASVIRRLIVAGVEDIGVWGYPSDGCSILNNAEPEATWTAIMSEVRDAVTAVNQDRDPSASQGRLVAPGQ